AMSFYWQNAVPQESGQSTGSTWDNINLGNTQPQQQQPAQQSFSYENQQNAGGYEQYVNPYADQWAAYHAQQAAQQQQQQQAQVQQQAAVVHQPQIEHQPILTQAPVELPASVSVPTTDHPTQESQSNHTTYDGWGQEGWTSHEPSVEPQVQPPANAQQYYYQQQQYYQEQIPQQPAQIEQNWAAADEMTSNASTLVPSTTSTVTIPSVETAPVELPHQSVKEETPQPSLQPAVHYEPVPPAAALDFGFDDEIVEKREEVKEEERVEIKLESHEENTEVSAVAVGEGWGEEWKEEREREEEAMDSSHLGPSHDQPRTSTPSPVEHEHREAEPTASPIEICPVESVPAPSPSPSPIVPPPPPPLSSHSMPPPPPPLAPLPIVVAPVVDTPLSHSESSSTKPSPLPTVTTPSGQTTGMNTEDTQKTSPPASLDSWVEVSSSGSDAVTVKQPMRQLRGVGVDGVPPIDASSPARPEKRSSVSSVVGGVVENGIGMERRREDSDSTHDGKTNVRDKFKNVKQQYPQIFDRFTQYRQSAREHNKTPTRVNPLLVAANHGGARVVGPLPTKNSTPKDHDRDSFYPPQFNSDISAIDTSARMHDHADHSLNMSLESRGYGEDLVDAYRKDRHRTQRSSRPASRAKSEYGDPLLRQDRRDLRDNRSMYDQSHMVHPQYGGYYPSGRYSLGRHSSMGMPYSVDPYENSRRPHSTYDQAARMRMERSGRGQEYDAFEYVSSEESEEDDEQLPNESDNEMRRISQHAAAAAHSRSSIGMRRVQSQQSNREKVEEMKYYFGFVRMEMKTVDTLLSTMPPPPEFWRITPIARVAYLYRTSLQGKNYLNVPHFMAKFNYEFYKFMLVPGCTEVGALIKICESLLLVCKERRQASSQKAYEASQRQLFSDDRETPESRLSDRPSVYDHNQTSDVDDYAVDAEPLKFRLPHAFATFGPGGKILQVQPGKSMSAVMITDVNCTVKDREMQRNVAISNHFKGPLAPEVTPPHTVRAYISRQIERIRRSDLAQTDPRNDDVIDCLLIWQLLDRVVMQHGKVTGPDMAELLVRSSPPRRERGSGGGVGGATLEIAPPTADPRAFESFTQLLSQGLIDDAIGFAMDEGLFTDALIFARRLAPHRIEEIEKRHLATRPISHPALTLLAVAGDQAAPCLNQMASEDRGGWRLHAALIFANLNTENAMENIRRLGEELVRRDCNAAADFCFLSVALLAGKDTFTPTVDPSTGFFPTSRRHIELIHASIPDDVTESAHCEYGFSLTDLHATEIFDFGSRLSGGATNLTVSAPYQRKRIQYAKLLASWGGFSNDAFRYCVDVATKMWCSLNALTASELEDLVELADRLHKLSAVDESQTIWIGDLRQVLQSNAHQMAQAAHQSTVQHAAAEQNVQPVQQLQQQQDHQTSHREELRERSDSISTEAAAWHSREDQLEMRGERREEEKREKRDEEGVYSAFHQQHHHQPAHAASTESHHHSGGGRASQSLVYDDYSSGTNTEGGEGVTSEESTPRRERSASIHDDFHVHSHHSTHSHSHHHHHQQQHVPSAPSPNPLAPLAAAHPVPAAPAAAAAAPRAPAPVPPMPALPIAPTPAAAPPPAMQQMQQPKPQPQLIKQETAPSGGPSSSSAPSQPQQQQGKGSNAGWGGWLKEKVIKHIPSNNQMKLPDDSKKTIYYDEKLGKYVGDGVEEEAAPPPPPMMANGGGEGALGGGGGGGG
ncbi:hypothetical protein PFISCL1PPCAC_24430, partial [Pristionchus fissidentatus]